jgi:hypothetical protein
MLPTAAMMFTWVARVAAAVFQNAEAEKRGTRTSEAPAATAPMSE